MSITKMWKQGRCNKGKHSWSWMYEVAYDTEGTPTSTNEIPRKIRHLCSNPDCAAFSEWIPHDRRIEWRVQNGLLDPDLFAEKEQRPSFQRAKFLFTAAQVITAIAGAVGFTLFNPFAGFGMWLMCMAVTIVRMAYFYNHP